MPKLDKLKVRKTVATLDHYFGFREREDVIVRCCGGSNLDDLRIYNC